MSDRLRSGWIVLKRSVLAVPAAGLLLGLCFAPSAQAQVQVIAPEPDTVDPSTLPERHQVKDGETLSSLAERYLGNGDAWPKLWSFNPEVTNPHWIYPGLVLKLKNGVAGPGAPEPTAITDGSSATRKGFLRFAARRRPNAGAGTVVLGEQVYLDKDALEQAARIVGSSEDHLMASPSDEVYLKFKDGIEPTIGKEVTVFLRLHRKEVSAKAGKLPAYRMTDGGEIVRVQGALRIVRYDSEKHIATAVVTEAMEGIERGFEVADVPRRLAHVTPKTNAQDVKASIIAASRPLGTLGDGQVVFIDAGAKKGVEVGNRFLVVRQGDPWRKALTLREELTGEQRPDPHPLADSAFPTEVVAELRVLYVRPESATALITSSNIEVNPGEHVEMRSGY
ncbi:MAG: hypothetical protein JWN48_3221 [Myxococcaceae bacterium]|nr:hypothetical protein [Myxococcaceae bacterium]